MSVKSLSIAKCCNTMVTDSMARWWKPLCLQYYDQGICHNSHSIIFARSRQLSAKKSSDKPNLHYLLNTKWQVSNLLVNTVDHLAAKEADSSLRSWWRPKTEVKGEWMLDSHLSGGQKHDYKWLSMNANFAAYLLDVLIGNCILTNCHINIKGLNMSVFPAAPKCPKNQFLQV